MIRLYLPENRTVVKSHMLDTKRSIKQLVQNSFFLAFMTISSFAATSVSALKSLESLDSASWHGKMVALFAIICSVILLSRTAYQTGTVVLSLSASKKDDFSAVESILLGLGTLSIIGMVLGHLGFFNRMAVIAVFIILNILHALFCTDPTKQVLQSNIITIGDWLKSLTGRERFLCILIVLYGGPKLIESLSPNGQGDPLYYHVYSAWRWIQAGSSHFDPWFPWFLQGGSFEYLFGMLGTILNQPLALLIAAQTFHAFVSIILGGLVVYKISSIWSTSRFWSLLAALAFLTIPVDPLVVIRAKNDGFVAVTLLAAIFCYSKYLISAKQKQLFASILFCAVSLTIKHTALFVILPLAAVMTFEMMWSKKFDDLKLALKSALCLSPVAVVCLVRNYIAAGSPVFPSMTFFFPSPYVNAEIAAYADSFVGSSHGFFKESFSALSFYAWSKPFYVIGFALVFVHLKRHLWFWALSVLTFLLTINLSGGAPISLRFSLALLGIMSVSSAVMGASAERRLSQKSRLLTYALIGIALLSALFNSKIELPVSRLIRRGPVYWITSESMLQSIAKEREFLQLCYWINQNYHSGKILSTATGEGLLLNIPIIQHINEPRANDIIHKSKSVEEFSEGMRNNDFVLFLIEEHVYDSAKIQKIVKGLVLVKTAGKYRLYAPN